MTFQECNRRALLKASVVAGAVIGLPLLSRRSREPVDRRRLLVVAEATLPESARFAAAFGDTQRLAVGTGMTEVLDAFDPSSIGVVLGLTSDPIAMIAEQIAVEHGGQSILRWVHRYNSGIWRHEVDTAPLLLSRSGALWPLASAELVKGRLAEPTVAGDIISCCSGPATLGPHSSAFVVSWAFVMGRA